MEAQIQSTLRAEFESFKAEAQAFQTAATAEIESLKAQLQSQSNELHRLHQIQSNHLAAPSSSSRPKPHLPDPQKFDGKSHRFRVWLPEIKAKLRVDGEAIGDNTARFYYVYGNLEPTVQAMVLPQLSQVEESHAWD